MKIFFLLFLTFLLWSCNSNNSQSPYNEILSQPPYSSLTDSIRKQPGFDELYFRRAVLLNKNNLPEPALADFRKAWSLASREDYAIGVSNILLEKKPDSAIVFLKQAISELPKSLFLQLSLARAYDAMEKTDDALAACDYDPATGTRAGKCFIVKSGPAIEKGGSGRSSQSVGKSIYQHAFQS